MAISGIRNNYNDMYEGTYISQKDKELEKIDSKDAASAQVGKTQNSKENMVSNYYSYLQKNYDGMSNGNVTISSEYLKKCLENSKNAKELEDFLRRIPELEKQGYEQLSAQNKAMGGTVTYYQQTWMINKDGSIQSTVYSVTETEMTNVERMKKSIEERLEKQKERKEEEKQVEERKEEKEEQAKMLDENIRKISVSEAIGQEIIVKYIQAESELKVKAMIQKEKLKDVYYPKFDINV